MYLCLYIFRSVQTVKLTGMCYSINLQAFGHPVKVKYGGIYKPTLQRISVCCRR